MSAVKSVPEGYPSLSPYLIVRDGAAAIDFYQKVFGATLRMKLDAPGGRVGHAELEIGNGLVMLADEHPELGALAPTTIGGTPVGLHLYLEDVDAVAKKAVAAGATLKRPVESEFYGDRLGSIIDPFGHLWHIATHVEDVSPEEIQRRSSLLHITGFDSHHSLRQERERRRILAVKCRFQEPKVHNGVRALRG